MNNPLPAEPGIRVTLAELIEMRHRVREVQLFASPSQRSRAYSPSSSLLTCCSSSARWRKLVSRRSP